MRSRAARETVLRVPGGQVGRYRRLMVGARVREGEEVVLFLKGRAPVCRSHSA